MAHVAAGLFFALAISVVTYVVAVHTFPELFEIYEKHVKKYLEESEYISTWIGTFYSVLPLIAFTIVDDWNTVFFDCFHPFSLWLDALYSVVIVILLIVFIGDLEKNIGKIMSESGNAALQLACVLGYVLLKRSNCRNFNLWEARAQIFFALLVLQIFLLATLFQLQFKFGVPDDYTQVGSHLSILGIGFQLLQLFLAYFFRWHAENFRNDEGGTWRIKMVAIVLRMSVLSYDLWLYTTKGYWDFPSKRPLVGMTSFSLAITCLLAFCRYIGPEKLMSCCNAMGRFIQRCKNAITESCAKFPDDINDSCAAIWTWVKGERATQALAAAAQRRAERVH